MSINDRTVEISQLTLDELRADHSGIGVEQLAGLIIEAFREPPWNENFYASRLHFGLGIEMMRHNALLYVAKTQSTGKIIGYILGKELVKHAVDPRSQTLVDISGTTALDYLFDGDKRIYYVSGLAVSNDFRCRRIAERLSLALTEELRKQGLDYRLGRTDITAVSMRNLYLKLGFRELQTADANYPNRSYWLLTL